MEAGELFQDLESNQHQVVEQAKQIFHELFNSTKDSWLLNGLFDYYVSSGSIRAVEVLVGVREPHDKYLFDKVADSLKGPQKLPALTLLSHVVCRHPTWLYKISHHTLLKDLIKLLKAETDMVSLMSALLIIIVLLPIIAGLFGPYLQELFEVFSRLAAWNTNNPNKVPEGHLLHLQVGLYALFNRLYGMFPCNFLSYLRLQYSTRETIPVFSHTIKPMLDTVRMHPLLVTASKDTEVAPARWKRLEANDVIIECAKFSVESGEKGRDDCNFRGRTPSFRSRSSLEFTGIDGCRLGSFSSSKEGVGSYSSNLRDGDDVWSPSVFCAAPTPPESAPTSVPHTPIPYTPVQTYAVSSSFPQQEGTSPPEAAVEATPESTPVKDLRQPIVRAPLPGSNVPRALNSFAAFQNSTQSQPSSPLRKEPSPFRFPPAHDPSSAFQVTSGGSSRHKESNLVMQKIQKVVQERKKDDEKESLRPKTPGVYQPSSPLRVINHPSVWESCGPGSPHLFPDHSDEDKEVETTMRLDQPPVTHNASFKRGDSVIQDPDGEEFEDCTEDGEKGCVEGGLHMPDSSSIMNFARHVSRLRFHSQCAPDNFHISQIGVSSSSSPREGSEILGGLKVRRAVSCPEMKKAPSTSTTMADLGVSALDETVEEEGEDTPTINGHTNQVWEDREKKKLVTSCTQTDEPQPQVYEHLFLSVFPPIDHPHSAPPDMHTAPVFQATQSRFSPCTALENYIETAIRCSDKSLYKGELKSCKEQLELLMLQLQYERHRREVHAERNRRLLAKSRTNKAMEEHNSALRDQVTLLQNDIEMLRNELEKEKREEKANSDQLQQTIRCWQNQCNELQKEYKEAKAKISILEQQLKEEKENKNAIIKDYNNTQAQLFELENSLRNAAGEASLAREMRSEISTLQHRIAIAGENEARLKARLLHIALHSQVPSDALLAKQSYTSHVSDLEGNLDSRGVQLEAARARLTDLELQLERKDLLIYEHKEHLKHIREDHTKEMKKMEKKLSELREINNHQEERMLALYQRIEVLEHSGKKSTAIPIHHSQAGSPPLSNSLSSSGTLSLSGADLPQITNLQLLVDNPDHPGTSSKDQASPQ